jgi:folylpolyglutamate synthase/dihydropteroate synthase
VEDVETALTEARDRAREQGTAVLVCGSFFLAAEVAALAARG